MPTKLFSCTPKRLFKSSAAAPTVPSGGEEKDGGPNGQALSTPLPVSTVSTQQNQVLSPLTPFATEKNNASAQETASNKSTPTANNVTTERTFREDEEEEEAKAQAAIDSDHVPSNGDEALLFAAVERSIGDDAKSNKNNDAELQSALDSLERNLKELRYLDSSGNESKDEGYDEFLGIINRTKDDEAAAARYADEAKSDVHIVAGQQSTEIKESSAEVEDSTKESCSEEAEGEAGDDEGCDCRCLLGARIDRPLAVITPLHQPQQDIMNNVDGNEGINDVIQKSVESLRADANMSMVHKELIISEILVIQKSLDKISSLSINEFDG